MVSDSGGFDDKSFNQTSYKGLTDAKTELGIETGEVESTTTADFAKNIQSMVDAECNIIVTVGFLSSDDTLAAAKKNTDIKFAIVDNNDPKTYPAATNLKPLVFNTAQSSFMAGYLAAGMSQTKKVGTFGGLKIPTVTIFMDGFAQGVEYYNQQKNAKVQVLGWDAAKQDGQFVPGDAAVRERQGRPADRAQGLISQGADIVFPVAGPAGEGALQAAKASGGKVNAIWVDTDGCVSAETYCSNIMSSVYKAMDVAVWTRSRRPRTAASTTSRTSARWRTRAPASRRSTTSTQGPGRSQDRARHPEGRHHPRQDQDRVQVATLRLVTEDATSAPAAGSRNGLQLRGITKRFGSLVANDSHRPGHRAR